MPAPISRVTIEADRDALRALKTLSDYVSVNPDLSKEALVELESNLLQLEEEARNLKTSYEATRARALQLRRLFHDRMLSARLQVTAQYGRDSQAVEAVGLTKVSARRRPRRRVMEVTEN
jgi:hypothetical protein